MINKYKVIISFILVLIISITLPVRQAMAMEPVGLVIGTIASVIAGLIVNAGLTYGKPEVLRQQAYDIWDGMTTAVQENFRNQLMTGVYMYSTLNYTVSQVFNSDQLSDLFQYVKQWVYNKNLQAGDQTYQVYDPVNMSVPRPSNDKHNLLDVTGSFIVYGKVYNKANGKYDIDGWVSYSWINNTFSNLDERSVTILESHGTGGVWRLNAGNSDTRNMISVYYNGWPADEEELGSIGIGSITYRLDETGTWKQAGTFMHVRVEEASLYRKITNVEVKVDDVVVQPGYLENFVPDELFLSVPIGVQDGKLTGGRDDIYIGGLVGQTWRDMPQSNTMVGSVPYTGTETKVDAPSISFPTTMDKIDFDTPQTRQGFTTKFPFSLPWDVWALFKLLNASPKAPKIDIKAFVGTPYQHYAGEGRLIFDFDDYPMIGRTVQAFTMLLFAYALIKMTNNLIGRG